ncbi:MAG TPA: hypothetical protein VK745_23700 [Polyangiaceae bacterium]|jgi:hypothetical protein|nr:hypothetical protein [Polyangiaceae bacterium]
MFWTLEALDSDGSENGDRYRITVEQATMSAPVSVFDQMIDYTTVATPTCAAAAAWAVRRDSRSATAASRPIPV